MLRLGLIRFLGVALALSVCIQAKASLLPGGGLPSTTLFDTVNGQANLYFDDWGHAYNLDNDDLEFDALGDGFAPSAFSQGGLAFDFSGFGAIIVDAFGFVVDFGMTPTGPAGTSVEMWDFRGLPVYNLIGIWSSTPGAITPVGDAFHVGANALLTVPTGPSYLFFGNNDGMFHDNEGFYNVFISTPGGTTTQVPEPTPLILLATGLVALALRGRRS
ncbi:MAG: PEP-CTERM sorting domain-containing protein [Pseudomonadota bacterium]